jgi:hypothetical protein
LRKIGRRSPVKGLTLGAVVLLLPIAVLLAAHSSSPPYGYATDARPARAFTSKKPGPTPGVTQTPTGYELALPGDRTPAGEPSAERVEYGRNDGRPGVFATFCPYSHSAPDDPIVFPSQPGASHLHDFFGNKATNAFSTADSLRSSGSTTCNFVDTASYWIPALYEDGERIVPDYLAAYYSAGDKYHATIEPFPRGLKMVVKDADATRWYCYNGRPDTPMFENPPSCPEGEHLAMFIAFPDCWDGKYLDVPDHRSHMAYAVDRYCPSTHPVPVTQLRFFIGYGQAHGGSDVILAPQVNPSLPHADVVNSWNQELLTAAVRECIKADVFCDGWF